MNDLKPLVNEARTIDGLVRLWIEAEDGIFGAQVIHYRNNRANVYSQEFLDKKGFPGWDILRNGLTEGISGVRLEEDGDTAFILYVVHDKTFLFERRKADGSISDEGETTRDCSVTLRTHHEAYQTGTTVHYENFRRGISWTLDFSYGIKACLIRDGNFVAIDESYFVNDKIWSPQEVIHRIYDKNKNILSENKDRFKS